MNKIFNPVMALFRMPSAYELAQRELEEARRELLKAKAGAEYATRMSQYHGDRIARLTGFLAAQQPVEAAQ